MSKINYFFEKTPPFKRPLPAKKWIRACALNEGWDIGALNFIFCSDKYLQKINKQYLNRTYFTDVISFDSTPTGPGETNTTAILFGDVFISVDRVKENHKTYKTIFAKELKRVMIHGALHLMGFKDSSEKEALIMKEKENHYINLK